MSGKRPKGTFQDRYNKPDSAIPPVCNRIFYMVLIQIQQSLVNQINRLCGPCQDKKVRMK